MRILMSKLNNNKKYHFTYKTTNIKTNQYYYGAHSTDNLYDNYIGSGKLLLEDIKKYGKENFKVDLIERYENVEEKFKAE